jgi:hypothetical protein
MEEESEKLLPPFFVQSKIFMLLIKYGRGNWLVSKYQAVISLSIFLILLLLVACNSNKEKKAEYSHMKPLIEAGIIDYSVNTIIDNQLASFYPLGGKLIFSKNGKQIELAGTPVKGKGLWLENADNNVYAIRWDKTREGKTLHVATSFDKGATFESEVLITKGGVLPQISIATKADKLALAYIAENEPGYQIYFNRSLDAGQTWLKNKIRLNSLYTSKGAVLDAVDITKFDEKDLPKSKVSAPMLAYLDNTLVALWQELSVIDAKLYMRIVTKKSMDDGVTWSAEQEIYRSSRINLAEMKSIKVGNEIYSFFFENDKGLVTFKSFNKGKTWQVLPVVEGTKSLTYASNFSAAANDKQLFLTYSTRSVDKKDSITLLAMTLGEDKWNNISDKLPLTKISSNTPLKSITKTANSKVTIMSDGVVLLAWEDYRYLIPTVMLSYSVNNAESWTQEPILIASPGKVITDSPKLLPTKDKLFVISAYYDPSLSILRRANLYYGSYNKTVDEKTSVVAINFPRVSMGRKLSPEEKAQRLLQRSKELWTLRVKEKYSETYDIFDPLYRSMFSRDAFVKTQGKIRFTSYKAVNADPEIYGQLGYVNVKVKFYIAAFALLEEKGIAEVPPPQERNFATRWGWLYDDWYFLPDTLFDRRYDF